jgi:hypothetical protein
MRTASSRCIVVTLSAHHQDPGLDMRREGTQAFEGIDSIIPSSIPFWAVDHLRALVGVSCMYTMSSNAGDLVWRWLAAANGVRPPSPSN